MPRGIPWLMEHSLLNHPAVEGHMCSFQRLAVTNEALRNHVQDFVCEGKFLFLWDACPGIQLLGHEVRAYVVCRNGQAVFRVAALSYILGNKCEGPVLPRASQRVALPFQRDIRPF